MPQLDLYSVLNNHSTLLHISKHLQGPNTSITRAPQRSACCCRYFRRSIRFTVFTDQSKRDGGQSLPLPVGTGGINLLYLRSRPGKGQRWQSINMTCKWFPSTAGFDWFILVYTGLWCWPNVQTEGGHVTSQQHKSFSCWVTESSDWQKSEGTRRKQVNDEAELSLN